jgi:hypothetical protein
MESKLNKWTVRLRYHEITLVHSTYQAHHCSIYSNRTLCRIVEVQKEVDFC